MAGLKTRFRNFYEFIKYPPILYRYLGGAIVAVLLLLTGFFLFTDRDNYLMNLYTEVSGVIVTIVFVNSYLHSQSERRHEKELKDRLLREVRSPESAIARHALHEIRDREMLTGDNGLLRGQKLSGVKWKKGQLTRANLEAAYLPNSNLKNAVLDKAQFSGATLWFAKFDGIQCFVGANYRNAKMNHASITNSYLYFVDYSHANLQEADFSRSNLFSVSLEGTDLRAAKMKVRFCKMFRLGTLT